MSGRGLQAADAGASNQPVVVNEAFMRAAGRNPVGARVRTQRRGDSEPGPWHEIVGVVTDVTDFGGDETAFIYRAASAADLDPVTVVVRVAVLLVMPIPSTAVKLTVRVAVLGVTAVSV